MPLVKAKIKEKVECFHLRCTSNNFKPSFSVLKFFRHSSHNFQQQTVVANNLYQFGATPDFFPIILLAPSYVCPLWCRKLRLNIHKISFIAFTTVTLFTFFLTHISQEKKVFFYFQIIIFCTNAKSELIRCTHLQLLKKQKIFANFSWLREQNMTGHYVQ